MKQLVLMFLLLGSSGSHLASAVYAHSPEEVVVDTSTTDTDPPSALYVHSPEEETVHNGTTGRVCGVPAIQPKVPICPTDGLGIVDGEEAVPHSWPWQVSIQVSRGRNFCGGSLINKDWVLTAAHCEISLRHRVILGQHNLKKRSNFQNMSIGKVFTHPDYIRTERNHWDYDIALIKLQSPAEMSKHVSPMCLPETGDHIPAGECVITGWGKTRSKPRPAKLQQACLPIISQSQCKDDWYWYITNQMFCAGASGTSTCKGDSGGPLVCEKNGAWTLYGITSWVLPGCPTNRPAVFASVPNLRAWMTQTMDNN